MSPDFLRTLMVAASTLCAACATHQKFPLEAIGNVIAISDTSEYKKLIVLPIPIGGTAVMPVTTHWPVTTRVYQVRLQSGLVVAMQSDQDIRVGDCVRLHYSSDLTSITADHNFIRGEIAVLPQCLASEG
jgi:hypothetical protein